MISVNLTIFKTLYNNFSEPANARPSKVTEPDSRTNFTVTTFGSKKTFASPV